MQFATQHGDNASFANRRSDRLAGFSLAAGMGAVSWILLNHITLMNDVVWQFWVARQLLGGSRLYTQIWEVNPPLWFWSAVPIEWLAERTGIAWPKVLITVIVGLGAVSAMLVERLLEPERVWQRLCLVLLIFIAVVIVPLAETGQREQLALMASLPYAALIARRHAGQATPVALAAAVGLLGAYGFAFKHYFVLVPLGLELWLGWHLRRAWRPWRPELIMLMAAAVVYGGCIVVFAPAYLTVMVPMVRTAYFIFNASPFVMLVQSSVLFWAYCAVILLILRSQPRAATSATMAAGMQAMVVTAAGFALAYWLQKKGWGYHGIPVTGAIVAATAVNLLRLRRPVLIGNCAIMIVWAATGGYGAVSPDSAPRPFIDRVPTGEALFVGAIDAGVAWPTTERRHLIWVSRSYSLWPVVAIIIGERSGAVTPLLRRITDQVVTATSQDIRCTPPWLIQIERFGPSPGDPQGLAFQDLLFRDKALRRFVADHYDPLPGTADAMAWQRRGRVAGITGPMCRSIRQ